MTETNTDSNSYLGSAPIKRILPKFALPCIISLLVSALYNIVDQIFIGQGVGYLGNAATNVVYPFTVIALALSLLVGDGCAAFFSISLGRGDKSSGSRAVGNGILLIAALSIALTAAGYLCMDGILSLFGVTEGSYAYAREYLTIILAGIPFYMLTSGLNAVIRADGSPAYSMAATVLGAVINLILDPVAIFVLGWGVGGAALATIIGQIASCVMTCVYFRKPKSISFTKICFKPSARLISKCASLGIASFITQISIVIVMAVANNMFTAYGALSKYGADIPLSVTGIVMKVFGIVVSVVVGIAVGGQPIIGYNFGAAKYSRVRETYSCVIKAVAAAGVVSMIVFEFFPQAVISLFGSENALYNEFAVLCFRIFLSGILLTCLTKGASIFLQAIGRPVKSMLLSLSRDVIFLIPGVVLLPIFYGVTGILWAAPIADILAFLLSLVFIKSEMRSLRTMEAAICGGLAKETL